MIIDTHCHIYKSEMENAEEIIKKAWENDIHLILNGTDPLSNRQVLELSAKYENVYGALGYLYSFADKITAEDITLLDSQLYNENIVAVKVAKKVESYVTSFHDFCHDSVKMKQFEFFELCRHSA